MAEVVVYSGADVVCPHCGGAVPGARLTYRAIAEREADAVAAATGVPRDELLRDGRRRFARARWSLWKRLIEQHRWPLSRVAMVCGGFDHTTVLRALQVLAREEKAATSEASAT